MRLSDFIQKNIRQIIMACESFARTLPTDQDIKSANLHEHITAILECVVCDMDTTNNAHNPYKESMGNDAINTSNAYDIIRLVTEYHILRISVMTLWTREWIKLEPLDLMDLMQFNTILDQKLIESMVRYKEIIEHSKNAFIHVLGHDLRTPLGTIVMSNQLLLGEGNLNESQNYLIEQIETSADLMSELIKDTLNLAHQSVPIPQ